MPLIVWGANVLYPTAYKQVHSSFAVKHIKLNYRVKKRLQHVKKDFHNEAIPQLNDQEKLRMMNCSQWICVKNIISFHMSVELTERKFPIIEKFKKL
jgi:hypothetical protein